jgi:hypothetical protein
VSPRAGGEADKFGNRYEGVWTVRQLLYVLAGHAQAVTVEPLGEPGEGAEFILERRGVTEAHQVKRQLGSANEWSLASLNAKKVLESARKHVAAGREFHFVSIIPAWLLESLGDRARRSPDLASFVEHMLTNDDLRVGFDYLSGDKVYGSAESAWLTLRGTWAHWPDERGLRDQNAVLAALLLDGAPGLLAATGLGELVQNNLAVRLDAATLEHLLGEYELQRAQLIGSATVAEQITSLSNSWKASVDLELLSPAIPRNEARLAADQLAEKARVLFMIGTAGGGKSAVLRQAVETVESKGWAVLATRLDRLGQFASTLDLGQNLGLTVSPVTALAAISQDRPSLLVVDQLDAVSLASGRMPENFDAIAALMREAEAFPEMRVIIACRRFDVDNDHRIRAVASAPSVSQIEVAPLTDDQVSAAVRAIGLIPAALNARQRTLLKLPLNLVLLSTVADQDDALTFDTDRDLLDGYWDRKLRECRRRRQPPPRFGDVVRVLADAMSSQQRLVVPASVLDAEDLLDDADILASEHVLVRDKQRFAFFHESFFDYAFARQWLGRNQTLVEFLLADEQELFRRGQVRQILAHLREDNPERFVAEVEELLANPSVRFHIKDVTLGILRSLPDPTSAEWEMVSRVLASNPSFEDRIWQSLRNLSWFERLDAEGVLGEWLAGHDGRYHDHALNVMIGAVKNRPDRMAELLKPHAGRTSQYGNWLLWIVRFANVHESRPLFDLLLDAIRSGEISNYGHNMWLFTYDLAKHRPTWAVELLAVHLVLRPNAIDMDDAGRVVALLDRDDALIRLVSQAAAGAPRTFCEILIPYLLTVMRLTGRESKDRLLYDAHFCYRTPQTNFHELEDVLLFGAAGALRSFIGQDPEGARPLLTTLAANEHDAAQWLLYEGLRGTAAQHYAGWAAELLSEGRTRFLSGYMSDSVWTARQLIQAISPHLSDEAFGKLEQVILDLRFPWEGRHPGRYVFNLLSAIEESRLSPAGLRRLGELRRLAGVEQPDEPEPIEMHAVVSPIPPEAAQHMSDDDWLRAIRKHSSDREDFRTFRGGAFQLSQVLKAETVKNPGRFARLALRLEGNVNAAYTEAILMGLGEQGGEVLADPAPAFAAMRHIASLQLAPNDHWLGWPLRHYLKSDIPEDVISLLIDRALYAADPAADKTWSPDETSSKESVGEAIYAAGINTARGSSALILGDVLVYDPDGRRTALVVPVLNQMAQDPSMAVRSCVAHVVSACLRHARTAAVEALSLLVRGDDRVLATHTVGRLLIYVGDGEPAAVVSSIKRMLASEIDDVREAGGRLAAFAGMEWSQEELLSVATASADVATRKGAAGMCAHQLPNTTNSVVAERAVMQFVNDDDDKVRAVAAEVAGSLRDKQLRPFKDVLMALISSKAYPDAVPQLLITLEHAPDRVDDLVIACAHRFVEVHAADIGNISTGAAGDAREVGQLVFRGYAQATSASARSMALDLIDQLLALNAYGVADLVESAER